MELFNKMWGSMRLTAKSVVQDGRWLTGRGHPAKGGALVFLELGFEALQDGLPHIAGTRCLQHGYQDIGVSTFLGHTQSRRPIGGNPIGVGTSIE